MAGEATPKELEELEELIAQNPEWQIFIQQLDPEDPSPSFDDTEAELAYAAHAAKMQLSGRFTDQETPGPGFGRVIDLHRPGHYRWKMAAGIAAVFLLTLAGLYLFRSLPDRHEKGKPGNGLLATNEVVTKKGSVSKVTLPDGSLVWLNADSKLTYAGDFTGASREVKLSGEAYFDIAKDVARPFIIHTDKINIRVLGTAFNVKSYPADEAVETALIRGKIEVTFNDRPAENIILQPNERLVVSRNQSEVSLIHPDQPAGPKVTLNNISLMQDSVVAETAWMQDKIAFSDESLLYISHMLERRFDVQFRFDNEEVKSYAYTGVYEKESLRKILELLSVSQKFNYSIEGHSVVITK